MKKTFIYINLTLLALSINAQDESKIEFGEAVLLSNSINSENHELMPILSNEGTTIYFVKDELDQTNDGYKIGQNIWTSTLKNNAWSLSEKITSDIFPVDDDKYIPPP